MIVRRTKDDRKLKFDPYLVGSDALLNIMSELTSLPVDQWRQDMLKPKGWS